MRISATLPRLCAGSGPFPPFPPLSRLAAQASQQIGDLDVATVSLKVNGRGEALVSYREVGRRAPRRARLGRRECTRARSAAAAGAVPVRLQRRLAHARPAATRARSATAAGRTTARRSSSSSPPARRRTAPTGRSSAGSACRRCAASTRSGREHAAVELHVSHWTGPLPAARGLAELDVRRQPAGPLRAADLSRHCPSTASGRPPRQTIGRAMRASSTSTPSTRSTAPAGSATPASSRTVRTGPSVTASSPRRRHPGIPPPRRAGRATASGTASP